MLCAIAYDIADDQRRNRIARILADYGNRAHESIFEIILDGDARCDSLHARLENAIDPTADSIRLISPVQRLRTRAGLAGIGRADRDEVFLVI